MTTLDSVEFDVEPEELGQVLREAQATLSATAGSREARADAIIRLVQELKDAQQRFPDGRALRPLLFQAQEEASALRERLWTDGQRLMRGRAIGMTLDRRCKRMEESVRLLEKAAMLDPTENPMLRADLDKARRRLIYLQGAQARAKTGQGERWWIYGIAGAAVIGILLLLYVILQFVPTPSLIARATPTTWTAPAQTMSPSITPSEAAPLLPADTASAAPSDRVTPTLVPSRADTATAVPQEGPTIQVASPRNTATSSPTYSPVPTRTPSPTSAPTAASTPTAAPSLLPTARPTLPPAPTLPAKPKPLTPTPRPIYPAPILLQPADVVYLSQDGDSRHLMQWVWEGTLQPDEWFDVRVWQAGMPHYGVAWTKQPEYLYDICLKGSGLFFWSIAVIRGTDGQWQADLSPEASPRQFSSSRRDEWCAAHGRYTLQIAQ